MKVVSTAGRSLKVKSQKSKVIGRQLLGIDNGYFILRRAVLAHSFLY
ncbi:MULTISPECIES: hypothetical protein [Aphanizomenonaceae]|uniref:Uncharacterized protein n=1 Tax=Dolichospermum heterosporum TAC447 TaxID=747523 RepID=A0ABY5LQT4_9CYAN|nr:MULTISPECIES: hypothetical protein [Aphanizomenonaceae]MBE9255888.1 hypothetical protein [Dolichospermum sp. LEGE 00246]MDK2409023.1 hypothetical protein [Aphanizomenon sp. 202]MDK2460053.1 hypothetical protein [Aphanizomenon sp. PH219]UUO14080.1 hypothetical protein NG743_18785 [Dolichospermum heterosporum TAC447]